MPSGTSPFVRKTTARARLAAGLLVLVSIAVVVVPFGVGGAPVPPARSGSTPDMGRLGAPLTITSFVASPSTVAAGHVTYLNVSTSGGVPPLSYNYSGLPYGCYNFDLASLGCSPRNVARFTITVFVTDPAGENVSKNVSLTVVYGWTGPPKISSVVVDPPSVAVDQLVTITVNVTSTSSLAIYFAGLPAGCASFNVTELQCVPKVGGTFLIYVEATDGFGFTSYRTATLIVTGGNATTSSSPVGLPPAEFYGVPAAVGIAVIAGAYALYRSASRRATK